MSKQDIYIRKIKLELDELNAKMGVVESKAQEAKDDLRDKYEDEMRKLRQRAKLAFVKLDQLKAAGDESWDKLAAKIAKVSDTFKHSFNYFRSQI